MLLPDVQQSQRDIGWWVCIEILGSMVREVIMKFAKNGLKVE
jgi:hypothetical protein